MGNNLLILDLLERTLGESKQTSKGNYAFMCPNGCHSFKPKLEINTKTQKYQCWICGNKKNGFRGNKLIYLFRRLETPQHQIEELKQILNIKFEVKNEIYNKPILKLPDEFKTFENLDTIESKRAFNYLKKRKINREDIIRYNIGYCEKGIYSKMIIIPSYDYEGKLNYFTTRTYESENNKFGKYKNPPFSRDIIPFELFINWNLPIILCEGPFDAITIKRNTIPLLGKKIQNELMKRLISNQVKEIYLILDKEAIKQTINYTQHFLNQGKKVYIVELENEDPNELGFNHITHLIENTSPTNQYDLMEKNLNL